MKEKDNVTEVVAALLWKDNKFLICQRPENKSCGLLWEFVGGKVEPGETKEQALIRECREELDIGVSVGRIFTEVTYAYPDITVHLTLFCGSIVQRTPRNREHKELRWISREEIGAYAFCPADEEILQKLMTCN